MDLTIAEVLKDSFIGKKVTLRGWVYRRRELKDKVFVVLRDASDIIQVVVAKEKVDAESWEIAKQLQIESSIEVEGEIVKDERAPTGYELHASRIKAFCIGEPFPLKGDETQEAIAEWRHLWIRSRKFAAITKVRHSFLQGARDYFIARGWIEVHPPILTPTACEESTTLFEVDYFGSKAYLSQSAQLYLEALVPSLEKVFSLTPSFRAEESRTRRHLHEYWHLEAEAAWIDLRKGMQIAEEMVKAGIQRVLEERQKELKLIGRDVKLLQRYAEEKFIVMRYDEVIEELQKLGFAIKWGEDLGADEEKAITLQHELPIFVTHYPRKVKAFYMKDDGKYAVCFDLLASEGYGEIIGGGEREDDYQRLLAKIKEFGLKVEDYKWYLDLRKYGSVPHAGFGLGLDRATMWICKTEHVRDTLPFPRLRLGWMKI